MRNGAFFLESRERTRTREEHDKIQPHLEWIYLDSKQVLYRPNEPMDYVFFPINAVGSMIAVMEDGTTVDVGTVGNEGMLGIPIFLGAVSLPGQTFRQMAGDAYRVSAGDFQEAVGHNGIFRNLIQRYLQALFNQISQSTACNR